MAVFLWKWCIFNLSTFNYKVVLQFFEKSFLFPENLILKLKYWKRSKFSLIVTQKHVNLSNRGLFWKSLVLSRRTHALSVGFKMKPQRKIVFQCWDKKQLKFCCKTCWKEQPFIFTVYYIFQTYVPFNM